MLQPTVILQPQVSIKSVIKTTHSVHMFITRRQYLQISWDANHPDHKRIVMETIDTLTFFYIKH